LQVIYSRARPFLPTIANAFAAHKVPIIIGIYLPMIESEYRPCFENEFGSKGLFQFLPSTAKNYGVEPDGLCDVKQEAPAAARYIADHMAELGDDAQSMTLVILSYNRGAQWVRGTLRQLRDSGDYERTFWTLYKNRERLDKSFQSEGVGYVPMFFAAAIIGENPRTFGLDLEPLSNLANASIVSASKTTEGRVASQ
jgi:peptidoglycan lytic transglycosylase D